MYALWAPAVLSQPASAVLPHPAAPLVAGLAAVAAVLLAAWLAAALVAPTPARAAVPPGAALSRRDRVRRLRLLDPAAAGRPRPRAPSAYPSAA